MQKLIIGFRSASAWSLIGRHLRYSSASFTVNLHVFHSKINLQQIWIRAKCFVKFHRSRDNDLPTALVAIDNRANFVKNSSPVAC